MMRMETSMIGALMLHCFERKEKRGRIMGCTQVLLLNLGESSSVCKPDRSRNLTLQVQIDRHRRLEDERIYFVGSSSQMGFMDTLLKTGIITEFKTLGCPSDKRCQYTN